MSNIKLLDCTLRDGGYVNDFQFTKHNIKQIIYLLTEANIDIIECGFLEDCEYDIDKTIYNTVEEIAQSLPADKKSAMYVAMACYGEYSLEKLSDYDGSSIDGIRVTFHYNEIDEALAFCSEIQEKGYKVFIQPVGTTSYSDEQLLYLISKVNELQPYAFYFVDTLGLMHQDDVLRLFYIINHNLDSSIMVGFHSHNNLQLSFSNGQLLSEINTDRIIALDSSIYGMGRGAGNLNTELIASYLNNKGYRYKTELLLEIVDSFISKIKEKFEWGYSVPYYLAAINGCHPSYASYLSQKQSLTVNGISSILRMMDPTARTLFDKNLIEQKYYEFQSQEIDDSYSIRILRDRIAGRNVIIAAPGQSLKGNVELINKLKQEEECLVIGVSATLKEIEYDYAFIGNRKRYNSNKERYFKAANIIHTSNVEISEINSIAVNYSTLLNDNDIIIDNSSLVVLNLLMKLSPKKVYLAGMDGYVYNQDNYFSNKLSLVHSAEYIFNLNKAIAKRVKEIQSEMTVEFITPSLYE